MGILEFVYLIIGIIVYKSHESWREYKEAVKAEKEYNHEKRQHCSNKTRH